ncbi:MULTISPECIES: DNA-processing protein DprA [unclassified Methylobacterium]|jgi:DNA processing protein|uniref:DNA-processing protein DprA n=1 Tax=unclassified Methylobacterium TaxID=2615210 RepID=UPI0006F5D77A|nr:MULTISPECIES: DNA-processing protein DprA [unclassified Methylobacterium]KQO71642.1 DNA processing protein DprA [Methylobacterium sp. Leaf89]KQO73311.1 DNA processing protein DprA [Methylobacterium sp. Leaf88]KQT79669.1 DNA processing protein DprA [Methylobacterium sp. Leaf465]
MQLTDAQRLDWLRLIRSEGIGPRSFRTLVNRFGGAGPALDALPNLTGRSGRRITPPSREEAEAELRAAGRLGARLVALGEADYPKLLQAADSAPPLIAIRGEAAILNRPAIALVGSRNASAAGLAFTERLARGLGEAGLVVVSGLARGIDARAHRAALARGTVAVLAGGQDRIYPANHAALVEAILEAGGAVLAEMPMGWEPRGRDFPRRNRIISGLAYGTVVVEAARRSGSLITARFALEQGREVFAVPGSPLDPRAEGTNDLIRQGATLVSDAAHVTDVIAPLLAGGSEARRVEALAVDRPDLADAPIFWDELDVDGIVLPLPAEDFAAPEPVDDRARLIAYLSPTPIGTDELARTAGLSVRVVQTTLLELELDGRIERHGSGSVSLVG